MLRTALVEELKFQRDALMHAAETASDAASANLKNGTSSDALIPVKRWSDIFDKSIDKLGLLQPEEVAAVLDAHLNLKELTSKLRLMELRIPPDRRRVEFGNAPSDFALIASGDLTAVAEMHSTHLAAFEHAISKLNASLTHNARSL